MWFNGMGNLIADEYLRQARELIQQAIASCRRDFGEIYEQRVVELEAALKLL